MSLIHYNKHCIAVLRHRLIAGDRYDLLALQIALNKPLLEVLCGSEEARGHLDVLRVYAPGRRGAQKCTTLLIVLLMRNVHLVIKEEVLNEMIL